MQTQVSTPFSAMAHMHSLVLASFLFIYIFAFTQFIGPDRRSRLLTLCETCFFQGGSGDPRAQPDMTLSRDLEQGGSHSSRLTPPGFPDKCQAKVDRYTSQKSLACQAKLPRTHTHRHDPCQGMKTYDLDRGLATAVIIATTDMGIRHAHVMPSA
ncbi:hypothetical protein V8C86DRAFT_462329 [Haematococcus lacustris]